MTWFSTYEILKKKKIPKNNKQTSRTNKRIHCGHRIKDQYAQISCISVYSQWTCGNRNSKLKTINSHSKVNEIV